MLGKMVHDPDGVEGHPGSAEGLGLLDIETTLEGRKIVTDSHGHSVPDNLGVSGYEIHMGRTKGADCARPMVQIQTDTGTVPDGASDETGRIRGCYMHGLFASDAYRGAMLERLGGGMSDVAFEPLIEAELERLAMHIEQHLDLEALAKIAQLENPKG